LALCHARANVNGPAMLSTRALKVDS